MPGRQELNVFQNVCLGCGQAMRPHHSLLVDNPGTVLHSGNGRCSTCRRAQRLEEAEAYELRNVSTGPRDLDPDETRALAYVLRNGGDDVAQMLGFYDEQRGSPLTDQQMMTRGLTDAGQESYVPDNTISWGEQDTFIMARNGKPIRGRRL